MYELDGTTRKVAAPHPAKVGLRGRVASGDQSVRRSCICLLRRWMSDRCGELGDVAGRVHVPVHAQPAGGAVVLAHGQGSWAFTAPPEHVAGRKHRSALTT